MKGSKKNIGKEVSRNIGASSARRSVTRRGPVSSRSKTAGPPRPRSSSGMSRRRFVKTAGVGAAAVGAAAAGLGRVAHPYDDNDNDDGLPAHGRFVLIYDGYSAPLPPDEPIPAPILERAPEGSILVGDVYDVYLPENPYKPMGKYKVWVNAAEWDPIRNMPKVYSLLWDMYEYGKTHGSTSYMSVELPGGNLFFEYETYPVVSIEEGSGEACIYLPGLFFTKVGIVTAEGTLIGGTGKYRHLTSGKFSDRAKVEAVEIPKDYFQMLAPDIPEEWIPPTVFFPLLMRNCMTLFDLK